MAFRYPEGPRVHRLGRVRCRLRLRVDRSLHHAGEGGLAPEGRLLQGPIEALNEALLGPIEAYYNLSKPIKSY